MFTVDEPHIERYRQLVRHLLDGSSPAGDTFAACRAVLRRAPGSEAAFRALCMLLEGALADPQLPIDDAQVIVPVLKNLARGTICVGDLL